MVACSKPSLSRLGHYQAWVDTWLTVNLSELPADECLAIAMEEGPRWLQEKQGSTTQDNDWLSRIVSCFKSAAKARTLLLGGKVPPSCDECDVLSESFNPLVECECSGLFPVSSTLDTAKLSMCGCKAIEHMFAVGEMVNSREDEWNSSEFFSSSGLTSAMTELALCHADTQPRPTSCRGPNDAPDWPGVKAPDRKPHPHTDLSAAEYRSLYPTRERIRLGDDAKHFFAIAGGVSLVDPGVQMAIADSGNDILIGDYCEAADGEGLAALQKTGAAAFAFLKICVWSDMMTDWQLNQLIAQTVQFRAISYYRDHALPRRPKGVYGSRMTGRDVHRHIDLGMAVAIVNASIVTGKTMGADEYKDLVQTTVLISDLFDLHGDTWRNQRENVVLRGVRGNLCEYLDHLLSTVISGAADLIGRGKIFSLVIMSFCNWMLMSSGHKLHEILHGTQPKSEDRACHYHSKDNGAYGLLLQALEPYGTLGDDGPRITMTRKELQLLYAINTGLPERHIKWMADVARAVLNPDVLRRSVDIVHYQWSGELGQIDYCA